MQAGNIIYTAHLFPLLDEQLIQLLRSLSTEEWNKPTIAKLWTVKDIAAHLLDTNFRTLSSARDKYFVKPDRKLKKYTDLVAYLNQLNADWVKATQRLSPQVLTDMLEITGKQCSAYWQQIDLNADAVFSVAWAGEETSKNWFHVAREYTEKFIHQQQIRDAVDKPGILTKQLFGPFIDTFMQALPYTYKNVIAPVNTIVKVTVSEEIGGSWCIIQKTDGWMLCKEKEISADAHVIIDPQTAWKLFSKGMRPLDARVVVKIEGNEELGVVALNMISVMA